MNWKRLALIGLIGVGAFGTAACNDGYGYSGVSMGYGGGYYGGDGYYGDPYYAGYGDPYYGGVGGSYFGWYGDYYYPGAGIYVYDRYRRPHRWNDGQRRYWEGRRGRANGGANWGGFDRDPTRDRGGDGGNRWNGNGDRWNGGGRANGRGGRRGDGNRWDGDRDQVTPPQGAAPPPGTTGEVPQRGWGQYGNRGRQGWSGGTRSNRGGWTGGNRVGGRGRWSGRAQRAPAPSQ